MKAIMKKIVAALTAATMLISLAACGGNSGGEGAKTEATKDQKIELRFASWQTNFKEADQKAADEYNKLNPNVSVKFEYYGDQNSSEYDKKVDMMILGGEALDVVMSASYLRHSTRANAGTYLALDPFLEAEKVKPEDIFSFMSPVGGKYYAFPGDWKAWLVLLNKDMLDAAGLPVPSLDWSWDDFREYAKKLTKGEGASKTYGAYMHTWINYDDFALVSTKMNSPIYKEAGVVNFDDPVWKNWMEFRNAMQAEGSLVPYSDVKAMKMNYRDVFMKGQCAMLPVGSWMLSEVSEQSKYPHDFVTTFAPLPNWKDGGTAGRTYSECHFYCIPKTTKNAQAAYDFLRWYTTKGLALRGVSVSVEKGVDKVAAFQKMISNEKYVDMEAMKAVLTNPAWVDNVDTISPPYALEVETLVVEECDKYLLGSQDIDTTIKNMIDRANAVIKEKGN